MRKRIAASMSVAGLVLASALALGGSTPAQAIPTLAQSCTNATVTRAGGSGWQQLGSPVWVNNPGFRRTVVNVNADVTVDRGAYVLIAYRVDTGPVQFVGARYLATWSEYTQARHTMAVLPVGGGWHRVFIYTAVVGPASANATIGPRCTTVEGNTA